jgi:hypothetical protein
MEKAKGALKRGPDLPQSDDATAGEKTLSEMGISRDQSSRWQQLAGVPEEESSRAEQIFGCNSRAPLCDAPWLPGRMGHSVRGDCSF